MRKSFPVSKSRLFVPLLGLFLAVSCASRPGPKARDLPPERPPAPPPREAEEIFPSKSLIDRVKENGEDIPKSFSLDQDGNIRVTARLLDGERDFEVVYDLENAQVLDDPGAGFPLIYRLGFTLRGASGEILWEDALVWRPVPGKEGLLLAMDDDYVETWEEYLDFFDLHQARITFFLQGGFQPFSRTALERGHDVGFHTLSHQDLRKLSPEDFMKEAVESAESFRQEGVPLLSFAFPFGFSEPWMRETLRERYGILRGYGVTYHIYREEEIALGYITSRAIDNTVIKGEESFDALVSLMLRTVKFLGKGQVLPLTTHTISDTAPWGISPRRLEFLFQSARALGLRFYRYRDFIVPQEDALIPEAD